MFLDISIGSQLLEISEDELLEKINKNKTRSTKKLDKRVSDDADVMCKEKFKNFQLNILD